MRPAESKLFFSVTLMITRLLGRFSRRASGPAAARLWFTPWKIAFAPRAREIQAGWMQGAAEMSFETSVGPIAARAKGRGPAVLLVHGWGESGASLGAFIAPLVDAGYRAVAIDLPGHGASRGGQTHGFELAAAIREVATALGGVRAVIAHSMGAFGTLIALHEGLRANAVVLVAPTSRLDHAFATFCEFLSLPPRAADGLRRAIERRFGRNAWREISGRAFIDGVDVPALVLHDRDDPQVSLDDSTELVSEWPSARLIVTEGMGHDRALRSEDLRPTILGFIRDSARSTEVVPA
ncbi:MAG: alpha/beta hydrolase [Actinomycetota bacterium]